MIGIFDCGVSGVSSSVDSESPGEGSASEVVKEDDSVNECSICVEDCVVDVEADSDETGPGSDGKGSSIPSS